MNRVKDSRRLLKIYQRLFERFGPRHWWPGDSELEIIIGAILTQNTAWPNVEKAIANLKRENLLDVKRLYKISEKKLSTLIRPVGYYHIKARRLKNFINFLENKCRGDIYRLFSGRIDKIRRDLLDINGIGPETADSILLYAGKKPVFVIDAYTRRIFARHGFIKEGADYCQIQDFFMKHLPRDVQLYNEFHALIVETGKKLCKSKKPLCTNCPLRRIRNA